MSASAVAGDWWPKVLQPIPLENPLATEHVLVAENGQPWGTRSYRYLYTALAPPELSGALLSNPGGIGYEVRATGPHPAGPTSMGGAPYEPRFYIDALGLVPGDLEPLCVAWTSANRTYIAPDQGFLMTYGLIPRFVTIADVKEVHWDDPSVPRNDVVISIPVSEYQFPLLTRAHVSIDRDYLQDYATIRKLHMIQVYFAERWEDPPSDIEAGPAGEESREWSFPGRLVRLFAQRNPPSYLASVWGTRPLIAPGSSPVTKGRWEYGELIWPGIDGVVTHDRAMSPGLDYAYVTDSVLGRYEGRPGFSVNAEYGGVSYGGQWSTGNTARLGRDLIRVELKKLYEGNPPEVVQHFHRHAVPLPAGDLRALHDQPNIATRTRRIVYALVTLGEEIAALSTKALGRVVTSMDTVRLSRGSLDYEGWWENPIAEQAARHAPMSMTKDMFLSRCAQLDQLVVEAIDEGILRETLVAFGVDAEQIKGWRSLKLLAHLMRLAVTGSSAGLRLPEDAHQMVDRVSGGPSPPGLSVLEQLHELRIVGSHRSDGRHAQRLAAALAMLGVDRESTASGWGLVLDRLYDEVARELEETVSSLNQP